MDIKQIKDSLNKIFNKENRRIIYWYDPEKEFEDTISSIEFDGVNILHLNKTGFISQAEQDSFMMAPCCRK